MEWDHIVEFQVVRDVGVGEARVGWIGLNTGDSGHGDVRLAPATAAELSVDYPVVLGMFSLSEIPVREVVATADVVVVLSEGTRVEDTFHWLALPASR